MASQSANGAASFCEIGDEPAIRSLPTSPQRDRGGSCFEERGSPTRSHVLANLRTAAFPGPLRPTGSGGIERIRCATGLVPAEREDVSNMGHADRAPRPEKTCGLRSDAFASTIEAAIGLAARALLASGALLLLASIGPRDARALDVLFPAYANPCCGGGPAMWSALIATAGAPARPFGLHVVFDPASGPGASVDPNYIDATGIRCRLRRSRHLRTHRRRLPHELCASRLPGREARERLRPSDPPRRPLRSGAARPRHEPQGGTPLRERRRDAQSVRPAAVGLE